MTNEKTQENQTISTIIEVQDLENIILTFKGKVVGHIEIEKWANETRETVEFVGRPVNVIDYKNGYFSTHGFACSSSIQTSEKSEVATAKDFIVAMAQAGK